MVSRRRFLSATIGGSLFAAAGVKITAIESFTLRVPDGGSPDPLKLYR
jgi:hypothetical protein